MSVCVHEHICASSCVYFDNGACFIASLPQLSKSESPLTPAVRGSVREIICSTHTHRSTPADRTVKRGEIEEDVEQRKEQIGCRSREEWGLAKPRRSGSLRDVEMNESLPRNQLIPGPRSVPRLRNAHTI